VISPRTASLRQRAARATAPRFVRGVARALLAGAAFALALAGSPASARADEAAARQHFKQGIELYDKKQYQPALASFRAAYAEKASPGIKQNIALCLKFLGHPVEAATAFDEALDEGRDTLKPDVRAAMEQELGGLALLVATVHLRAVAAGDRHPLDTVVVSVDGRALTPAALRRPIRLEPGIHVFTAHAEGLADPPEKKLSLLAGSPVDATFELGAPSGILTVRPSVADAVVQIDGVAVGRGAGSGTLPSGLHRITVSAPDFRTTTADVVISSGASVEFPITMLHPSDVPAYEAPVRRPPPAAKKRYVVPMIAYEGQSFRLAPILGERAGGTKRQFTGATVGIRGGYRASKNFALELLGEVGAVSATYQIEPAAANSTTSVVHWELAPMVRFATAGAIRFTVASGIGFHGLSVTSDLVTAAPPSTTIRTLKGSGVSVTWLTDLGLQFDVGAFFLEAVAFLDVHGVGTTHEDDSSERMFLSSPSTRAGVRGGLGINF
jgi:hypothetical protein